jgi:hypothetical protein
LNFFPAQNDVGFQSGIERIKTDANQGMLVKPELWE